MPAGSKARLNPSTTDGGEANALACLPSGQALERQECRRRRSRHSVGDVLGATQEVCAAEVADLQGLPWCSAVGARFTFLDDGASVVASCLPAAYHHRGRAALIRPGCREAVPVK
jgi:hypothetical protein